MRNNIVPIILCHDNNYVIPSAVAIHSLLENADKSYSYQFHILHSDISLKNQEKLKLEAAKFENADLIFHTGSSEFDLEFDQLKSKGHYSKEIFYKLVIASIFTQYDKVIVSDVDVVFCGDVSQSYINFDINSDFYVAGVQNVAKMNSHMSVYNDDFTEQEINIIEEGVGAGYYIANLQKIRKENLEKKYLQFLKENISRLIQPEQDVINLCTHNKQLHLHLKNMVCSYMYELYDPSALIDEKYHSKTILREALDNPIQLHYATSTKPWTNLSCIKSELWLCYLLKTQFYRDYVVKFHSPKNKKIKSIFSLKIPYKENKFFNLKLEKVKLIQK